MSALTYPTRTAMVRNILREYRATTAEQRYAGDRWYDAAAEIARDHSRLHKVTFEQAAGVIAALSPQTQWWQNVMLADQALSAGAMVQGHTRDTMRKVNAIIAGADPLDVLGGKKVRSFYQNIIGTRGNVVTIDRHAWRTVCGQHTLGTRNTVPPLGYDLAVDAFIRAAEIVGLEPAVLQAIVWVPRAR